MAQQREYWANLSNIPSTQSKSDYNHNPTSLLQAHDSLVLSMPFPPRLDRPRDLWSLYTEASAHHCSAQRSKHPLCSSAIASLRMPSWQRPPPSAPDERNVPTRRLNSPLHTWSAAVPLQ